MALRGNLNDFSLPDVFQLVAFSRKTGVLRIQSADGANGSVWFRDGEVFFAQSNWHAALLGERLVRAQRVTPQALERALEIRAAEGPDGRRLGAILSDEGYISDVVLETFVQEQIQETIFDLMRWDDGEFDFEAMPDVAEEDIGLSISMENVIMEGSRRLDEWSRIKKKIPSMDVVFKMATAPGEGTFEISLKPIEWNLLLLVDGTRSVAEMARETSRTDFDVARIIYGLFSAGLLEFTGDDEVLRLRAEKRERNAVVAAARAKRRAAEEPSGQAVTEQPPEPEPEAVSLERPDDGAEPAVTADADEPAETSSRPQPAAEPPMLFGWELPGPTVQDAAVLEEMMGAVLQSPNATVPDSDPDFDPADLAEIVPVPVPIVPVPEKPPLEAPPVVPELNLPLIRVQSADELLTEPAPQDGPSQTVEQALTAVAEAAVIGLDQPSKKVESDRALLGVTAEVPPDGPSADTAGSFEEPIAESSEFTWEPAPVAQPTPEPELEPVHSETPALVPDLEPEPEPTPEAQPQPAESDPELAMEPAPKKEPESAPAPAPATEPLPEPEPEPEPEPAAPVSKPVAAEVSSYERELMSLGLGELSPDLFGVAPLAEARKTRPATQVHAEVTVFDLDSEPAVPAAHEPAEQGTASVDEAIDLSALLESLDRVGDEGVTEEGSASFDEFGSLEVSDAGSGLLDKVPAPESPANVAKTESYSDDMVFDPIGLSGGMTDELSALTGADRPSRPVVNVSKIPEPGSGVLRRDQSVDKDTLLRIIDGIKNL